MVKHIKKKKILITGGAGAIGSSLANYLAGLEGNTVDVVDNLQEGHEENLHKKKNLNFYMGSILDENLMNYLAKREYDYIFHMAARFANQTSVEFPKSDFDVNSTGTIKMLEFAKNQGELDKFIYTSSSCVYGNIVGEHMKEDDRLHPDTPYAISKLSGEYYVSFYAKYYNIPANTLRLFNVYGSNEYPGKYRNVIPNFIHKALNNIDLPVMGEGDDTRDYTHIEDAIEQMIGIALDKENSGEIYNVGSGRETRILDLANLIIESTESKSRIKFVPKREWDTVSRRKASIEKVSKYKKSEFMPLDKGIVTAINFVRDIQPLIYREAMF